MRTTLLLSLLALASCAPTKGYDGPELPKEQLALVKTSDSSDKKFLNSTAAGKPFGANGVLLLPGKQQFELKVSVEGDGKACEKSEHLNQPQYQSCLEDQRKARERNALVIPTCNIDNYLTTKETCLVPWNDYACTAESSLKAGAEYELRISAGSSLSDVKVSLDLEKTPTGQTPDETLASWPCKYLYGHIQQQVN